MSMEERPKMPRAQIVYGEVVYWVTIVAALICMVGPFIAMWNVDNNVLNPHFLFAKIFEGKSSVTVWAEAGPFKLTEKSLDSIKQEGVPEDAETEGHGIGYGNRMGRRYRSRGVVGWRSSPFPRKNTWSRATSAAWAVVRATRCGTP